MQPNSRERWNSRRTVGTTRWQRRWAHLTRGVVDVGESYHHQWLSLVVEGPRKAISRKEGGRLRKCSY
jgi:hypothetical protein